MLDLKKSSSELEANLKEAEATNQRESKRAKVVAAVLLLLVLATFVGAVLIYRHEARLEEESRRRMDQSGVRAIAQLRDHYTEKTWPNGKKTYVLSYSFRVNSKTYDGTCEVVRLPTQDTEYVFYDPENPAMNKLRNEAARNGQIADSEPYSWVPAVMTALSFAILVVFLDAVRRRRKSKP